MGELKITKGTIVRAILVAVMVINNFLSAKGLPSIVLGNDEATAIVSGAIALWAFWKNNSFTKHAIKADEYLKKLKEEDAE